MSHKATQSKKVVGVAIGFGLICIVLTGLLVFSLVTSANQTSQISSLNSQIASLQNQVRDLNATLQLQKSTVWVDKVNLTQQAGMWGGVGGFWANCPNIVGEVSVYLDSSTTNTTYIRIMFDYESQRYDFTKDKLDTGQGAVFYVLPALISIFIGNSDIHNGANETVTVTYYY
jgi:hypothetical protein